MLSFPDVLFFPCELPGKEVALWSQTLQCFYPGQRPYLHHSSQHPPWLLVHCLTQKARATRLPNQIKEALGPQLDPFPMQTTNPPMWLVQSPQGQPLVMAARLGTLERTNGGRGMFSSDIHLALLPRGFCELAPGIYGASHSPYPPFQPRHFLK